MLPFEFTVEGPPLSHQTEDRARLRAWMAKVRGAAKKRWRSPPSTQALRITVAYYHEEDAVPIDNDNLIKPIQDALNRLVYEDDRQLVDTLIRKTPIDGPIVARGESMVLLRAFSKGVAFVHVTIGPAADHIQILK